MRADNAALSAVSDSLGLSAATVDTEYTALTSVVGDTTGGLVKLQSLLVEAKTAGIDRSKIQADITQIQQQLKGTASAATFNGVNWLSTTTATPTTVNLVSSFSRVGSTPTTGSISLTVSTYSLYTSSSSGILDKQTSGVSVDNMSIATLTDSTADQTTLDGYISQVTAAINSVASAAADLGAVKNRISTNTDFVKSLMDSVDRGIGQLVDADMNQESTRLAALQVQQQLGVQALSIANNSSQSILSLFR
jgi:flagellin